MLRENSFRTSNAAQSFLLHAVTQNPELIWPPSLLPCSAQGGDPGSLAFADMHQAVRLGVAGPRASMAARSTSWHAVPQTLAGPQLLPCGFAFSRPCVAVTARLSGECQVRVPMPTGIVMVRCTQLGLAQCTRYEFATTPFVQASISPASLRWSCCSSSAHGAQPDKQQDNSGNICEHAMPGDR